MKCKKCGHLNKNNTYYCVKCGSPLESSNPIRQYKNSIKNTSYESQKFSRGQKLIIALVIIGILIVVLSAVTPPDLEFPSFTTPYNDTQETPITTTDQTVNKLNTTIKIGAIGNKVGEKITVNAYVTDENGDAVKSGTTSIMLYSVKYSGQVENGKVNIILPELSENNYETTVMYEGNEYYNPSETRTTITVNKENTKIDAKQENDEIHITLKSANDETIPDATITVTYANGSQTQEKTGTDGNVNIKISPELEKQEIKISYDGNQKYNPTETSLQVGHDKKDTKISTEIDEKDKILTITLTDRDNHKIKDATLTITNNNHQTKETTDNYGTAKTQLYPGENKITIKYDGNESSNPSETTVTTDIENNTTNQTNNKTNNTNNTVNDTNTTRDDVVNENNTTNDTTNDTKEKLSNETKIDTTFQIDNENNTTIVTLSTENNDELSGENVKIILDNGTEITKQTDSNGNIELDIDLESINKIELVYDGTEKYNSIRKTVQINH